MKQFFKRAGDALMPVDEAALALVRSLKEGAFVAVKATRPRNVQHHRLYWALCGKIAEAVGTVTPDNVSDVLKLRTGHCETIKTKSGLVQVPRSISFAAMDQGEFRAFFDRCCAFIVEEWLPGMKAAALRDEVSKMIGG